MAQPSEHGHRQQRTRHVGTEHPPRDALTRTESLLWRSCQERMTSVRAENASDTPGMRGVPRNPGRAFQQVPGHERQSLRNGHQLEDQRRGRERRHGVLGWTLEERRGIRGKAGKCIPACVREGVRRRRWHLNRRLSEDHLRQCG